MIKLVEVGLGVSIAPEMQIMREIEQGLLIPVPIKDAVFSRQLGLIFRKGQFFSPSVRAFLETLRRAIKPDNWIDESYFN
jgi:DNA-binding transcriptional LysR family regulator